MDISPRPLVQSDDSHPTAAPQSYIAARIAPWGCFVRTVVRGLNTGGELHCSPSAGTDVSKWGRRGLLVEDVLEGLTAVSNVVLQ